MKIMNSLVTNPNCASGYVRIDQAAQHMSMSVSGVRKLVKKRIIPAFHVTPKLLLFRLELIDRALAKKMTGIGGVS